MSSSIPHLQAAHWMISSVVPEKAPSTRLKPAQSVRVLALARLPLLAFAAAFSGRISAAARTRAAQSAPDGRADPGGSVLKCPLGLVGLVGGVGVAGRVSANRSGVIAVKSAPAGNQPVTSTITSLATSEYTQILP